MNYIICKGQRLFMLILKIILFAVLLVAGCFGIYFIYDIKRLFKFTWYKESGGDLTVPEKYRPMYRQWCMDFDQIKDIFTEKTVSSWSEKDKKRFMVDMEALEMLMDVLASFFVIGRWKDIVYVNRNLRANSKEIVKLGKKYGVV